jgi:VanZ family protein
VAGLLATFGKIRKLKKKKLTTVLITTTICMLYAATDEFHQGFVDGRSPKVMDVLIDTAGGLTAVIFFVFVWFVIDRKRKKNEFVGE